MSKTFAPWKKDYWIALTLWWLGVICLGVGIFWFLRTNNVIALAISFGSILPLYFGFTYQEHGSRRRHGAIVEKNALNALQKIKPDKWEIYTDWDMITTEANIDIVIRFPNAERCSVEIKSWRNWNKKYYVNRRKAKNQVLWQCEEMSTEHAIIWLPEAHRQKVTHDFQRRKNKKRPVIIIEGNAQCLTSALHKIIRWIVVVQFPSIPSASLREALKRQYFFKWEEEHKRWAGKCTGPEVINLRPLVEKQNGKLTVIKRI